MYEVAVGEDVFTVETWDEVTTLWTDHVWAVGADDAELTVKFVSC